MLVLEPTNSERALKLPAFSTSLHCSDLYRVLLYVATQFPLKLLVKRLLIQFCFILNVGNRSFILVCAKIVPHDFIVQGKSMFFTGHSPVISIILIVSRFYGAQHGHEMIVASIAADCAALMYELCFKCLIAAYIIRIWQYS